MERQDPPRTFEKCYIDNPDDFYIVQRLKSDEEVKDYLNNCLHRYDYWAVSRKWPESNQAKLMSWRCEVLKRILIERELEVPSLYDTVFGYEPPVKKRKLTIDGLQEEVRAAERALKEAKARARTAVAQLAHDDANDLVPFEEETIPETPPVSPLLCEACGCNPCQPDCTFE